MPITHDELQRIFRATGYLTNGQAHDVAELAAQLMGGATAEMVLAKAEAIREETYGDQRDR